MLWLIERKWVFVFTAGLYKSTRPPLKQILENGEWGVSGPHDGFFTIDPLDRFFRLPT